MEIIRWLAVNIKVPSNPTANFKCADAMKKSIFATPEFPGANIRKPNSTGYREIALGGIKGPWVSLHKV